MPVGARLAVSEPGTLGRTGMCLVCAFGAKDGAGARVLGTATPRAARSHGAFVGRSELPTLDIVPMLRGGGHRGSRTSLYESFEVVEMYVKTTPIWP